MHFDAGVEQMIERLLVLRPQMLPAQKGALARQFARPAR
jgi:hypothetical protein